MLFLSVSTWTGPYPAVVFGKVLEQYRVYSHLTNHLILCRVRVIQGYFRRRLNCLLITHYSGKI